MRLVQFFAHDLFEQNLHALTARRRRCRRNSSWSRTTGDEGCEVEPSRNDVVGLCLGTGRAFSCARKNGTISA